MSISSPQQARRTADTDSALLASAYAGTAVLMRRQGLHRQAEQRLRQAIELEPGNAQWHLELARLLRSQDPELAKGSYDAARSLGSPNAELEAAVLYVEAGAIEYLPPRALWCPDRLDIGAKLNFARHYLDPSCGVGADTAGLYRRHILQRTNGHEPESLDKVSVTDYELCFAALIESIKAEGFNDTFAIPVDSEGGILNGAHRLAAALALGLDRIPAIHLPSPWKSLKWGIGWFLHKGFLPAEINLLLRTWMASHLETARFVLIRHAEGSVADSLIDRMRNRFRLAGWRSLRPPSDVVLPGARAGDWHGLRYVLVEAEDSALKEFCDRQNECHGARIHCHPLSMDESASMAPVLLEEHGIGAMHPDDRAVPAIGGRTMQGWLRHASDPVVAIPPRQSNFLTSPSAGTHTDEH